MRPATWLLLLGACAPQMAALPAEPARPLALAPPPATPTTTAATETSAVVPRIVTPAPRSSNGLALAARDPRPPPRAASVVVRDVADASSLLASMPTTSLSRADVHRRLAEDYVELRKYGKPSLSANAIASYVEIHRSYARTYAHMDEVLFYLGLECEVSRDRDMARSWYLELIYRRPASSLVPSAYLAFGELFAEEARLDPTRVDLALQAYDRYLSAPTTVLTPFALWRTGQLYDARGETPKAAAAYDRLRRDFPQSEAVALIGQKL